ncbi:MAG: DNA repair protein RadC [Rikenellaceae bacterium]|jgi:DNA repair protein RadC|nr:DNA repair protein RadC [Bacteroidales bacterium]
MNRRLSIKEWREDERPREKLMAKSATALDDSELIAIILGSGTRNATAVDLARELLVACNNSLRELSKLNIDNLTKRCGIGPAKAVTIAALFEIAKRYSITENKPIIQIQSSSSAAGIISPILKDLPHEECWVLYLNRANRLISKERISIGGISATVVDVKIVIKSALEKLASSLILVHNHPSGNLQPGEHDKMQTKILKEAAALFDIALLDHLIIAGDEYFSFADNGII